MTYVEFNEKYKDYLEEGHYGLGFDNKEFTLWLDSKFQEFVKNPNFRYSQIKEKFGKGRFYCEGIDINQIQEVENKISEIK